jgi:NADPH:quinone reductase-like Zn-dependent oxidoreductase
MKAIVQTAFGGPDVLRVSDVPRPVPLPTEVLVEVRAVGLNPVEAVVRSGAFPLLGDPPFTLGWDISGVVVDLAPGVSRFAVGDEVYGMPFFPRAGGAYAEYVAAPARQLARKPAATDHVHAAAVPLAGLTAWQALVDIARLRKNQRVLVHGAGGGVGHLAVGIAKALGAHVTATASPGKHDFVRSLGADEVIDYRATDFTTAATAMDVVIDPIGGELGDRSLTVLRPGGLLLSLVGRGDQRMHAEATRAGVRFAGISVEPDYPALESLTALIDSGAVRPHVSRTFPFSEIAAAHDLLTRSPQGKIVLTP